MEIVCFKPCLEFAPRSQSSAKATRLQFAPSARYPDSLHSVRPQIRSPRWGEGESYKVTHEIAAINRHSEVHQNRKNPADYNIKHLQNNQKSSPETDQASLHLCILISFVSA